MHTLVCGRTRKNIKLIESATKTAIYFPPPFLRIHGYVPPGATRRSEDEVFITGETQENIQHAKQKLRELVSGIKLFVKDVILDCNKIDSILLDRLDKVRRVMEANGSYVLFPPLGSQRGMVRVQSNDVLHVERTVREIMALVGFFLFFCFFVFFFSFFMLYSSGVFPLAYRFGSGGSILQRFVVGHDSQIPAG